MAIYYNFLNKVLQKLIKDIKQDKLFILVVLVLLSIPLLHKINSFCFSLFILGSIITLKKSRFYFNKLLFLPALLYILMLLSSLWTIDVARTLPALSKELSLLIIPLCFMLFGGFAQVQKTNIIQYYSYGLVGYGIFYLLKACYRFFNSSHVDVFFYHELVTKDVNAVHVSVFMTVAFFYFFTKKVKKNFDFFAISILMLIILLLSSKNIIIVFVGLIVLYHLYYSKLSKQLRLKNLLIFALIVSLAFSFGKIKNRFKTEFQTNSSKSLNSNVIEGIPIDVHNVSIKEAWYKDKFTPNDFFPGTAFRVYQIRIFLEMLKEDSIFWKGYGLNASYKKIDQKGIEYNVYLGENAQEGYQKKNFHNQYVQNFADLGVFGFIFLVIILISNLKNAIKTKDFIHITFSILMISLFLTESFLWRQRGVVFFTMLYCLFNSNKMNILVNKKHSKFLKS